MKQFIKTLLASILGIFIGFFLILMITVGIISSFGKTEPGFDIKENSMLHVKLDRTIVDRAPGGFLENLEIPGISEEKRMGLNDILANIKKAKTDNKIKGIYLDLSFINTGLGTIEEIRNALSDFKESGKWIMAYSEGYSQFTYYLATVADEIYMYPEGDLDFKGMRTELLFFKGALEKLDIEAQIIRGSNNKFKSAVEPFMYDKMSDANREQTEKYLNSIWDHFLKGISKSRGIDIADLEQYADSLMIQTAADAVKYKLVDKAMYKDEVLTALKTKLGISENDDINMASFPQYIQAKDPAEELKIELDEKKGKIAVVYATGSIESGEGDFETIGSERISQAIRSARLDSTIKAVVLRINSPGGSALASDVIWREMKLTKEKKPVVVSMGDVAASGGYYIACAADKIFADETTITGSIGVFGVLPYMGDFFKNKLGITADRAKTNGHADMGSPFRRLDDFEYKTIQKGVDKIYDDFTRKVADGRGMEQSDVDEIGQGRVWTGVDAKEIGLIDEFGGLSAAVAYAASAAKLEDYKIKSLPEEKDPFMEILKQLSGEAETYFMKKEMGAQYKYYQHLQNVTSMEGYQMRLPYLIDFE